MFCNLETATLLAGWWPERGASVLDVDERGRVLATTDDKIVVRECP